MGPQGPQGVAGVDGRDGIDGATGPQGIQGDPGPMGMMGMPGMPGMDGPQGPQGEPGPMGMPGMDGPMGMPGMPGMPGMDGPQGPQGEPGPMGMMGMPGSDATVTVGAISSSSTTNGATINSGELSLAPADASNGGIVTTGSQTFAGDKTFSNNVTTNGSLTTGAITFPTSHGLNGEVLTTTGSGTLTWSTPITAADIAALQNQINSLNNTVNNLQSQISQLQNSGSWSPTVISGTMSNIYANYFVVNNVVFVCGNFANADFDSMGMYVDLNIPVLANFTNTSDVHGTVSGIMTFGESASGFVEAVPNSSTVRLRVAGAHMMAIGTTGSFVFSYKLPGATTSSYYNPNVSSGNATISETNYIVNGNVVMVNGNFSNTDFDSYGNMYLDISLPIATTFANSYDASGLVTGFAGGSESLGGYVEAVPGTSNVRLRASGAHGWAFGSNGSFVFTYKISSSNNNTTYTPTVSNGSGNFSSANYITVGNVVYVTGNFNSINFDPYMTLDISIPGSTFFNNASDVHGTISGKMDLGESVDGYIEAVPNSNMVRLRAAGAHQMGFDTTGSFLFSYIK